MDHTNNTNKKKITHAVDKEKEQSLSANPYEILRKDEE